MDCKELYAQKLMTAAQAAALVKSGDWVDYGWAVNTPVAVDAELAKRLPELEGVNFRGGILMWVPEIFQIDDPAAHMTWNSWHMGGIERKAIAQGFSFYSPIRYSELPRYYRESSDPVDVAVFQVTPMDEHGYFNFGPSASHLGAVCEKAKKIIVEVNTNMPRCLGGMENCVHVSQVSGIVEGTNPPIGQMAAAGAATEVDLKVANLIVPQIPNGACLQLGIGGMPNAIGGLIAQSDLKDLGVHTEMYVDAFVDIAKAGKINGSRKQLDKGRQVYAFGAGTQKMYDYLNDNPECMSAPVDYTNDIRSISALDNFISINNAVDIDLFGQVNAESAGVKHISGAGGQLDFVLGAYLSKGGKSFICLSSTFFNKKTGQLESRIRPTLENGSIVTDTRANVHYLCTEYGCVNLKGLTSWEKAEALISVAHPDFREELIREAETLHILPHWNWEGREGEKTPVFVYTNYPSAELFINGKSYGRQTKRKDGTVENRYRLMWYDAVYQPGEVKVVAYDEQGNPAAEKTIRTAGKPHHIELVTDRTSLQADGKDLAYVTLRIVDKDGNLCPNDGRLVSFKVKGDRQVPCFGKRRPYLSRFVPQAGNACFWRHAYGDRSVGRKGWRYRTSGHSQGCEGWNYPHSGKISLF